MRSKRGHLLYWLLFIPAISLVVMVGCHRVETIEGVADFYDRSVKVMDRFHFHDINKTQLTAAERYGIRPLRDRTEAAKAVRHLQHIEDTEYYKLERMDYSVPYLTKGAEDLLTTIGKRFQKKLKKAGYRRHRIVCTSMLRTQEDVDRLVKVNSNASKNSAHRYATTFDLSYVHFNRISLKGDAVSNTVMANVLGQVLEELRDEGRCYVIFERNQHCFHITSRR